MKYTQSMQNEGKTASGKAWAERFLLEKAGSGRRKRGLPGIIEDVSAHPIVTADVPTENMSFVSFVNAQLTTAGINTTSPDWDDVIEQGRRAQEVQTAEQLIKAQEEASNRIAIQAEEAELEEQYWEYLRDQSWVGEEMLSVATILGIDVAEITGDAYGFFASHAFEGIPLTDAEIKKVWITKDWSYCSKTCNDPVDMEQLYFEMDSYDPSSTSSVLAELGLPDDCLPFIQEGETKWLLERNAAAAGFRWVEPYLRWRAANQ